MKKCLLIVLLTGMAAWGYGQYDQQAKQYLDKMSNKYRSIDAFKADFSYTMNSPASDINEEYQGHIAVKGNKYRLSLGQQEIINNGKTQWTYLKDANEVNVADYKPSEEEVTPTNIYSLYKSGYKYHYKGEESIDGATHAIVDLVPEDKDQQVFKIRVWINKSDHTLKKWKRFEKNGNRYVSTVKSLDTNVNFKDNYFTFDKSKHKGVEVIDLR